MSIVLHSWTAVCKYWSWHSRCKEAGNWLTSV